jgi:hypothetical protein
VNGSKIDLPDGQISLLDLSPLESLARLQTAPKRVRASTKFAKRFNPIAVAGSNPRKIYLSENQK